MMGVIGRPGAPRLPLDLDLEHYLFFVEGVVREMGDENYKKMDDLYDRARRRSTPVIPASDEDRARDLMAFMGEVLT